MPFPNFHSCRLREPSEFTPGSFRNIKQGDVEIIIGRLKGEDKTTSQTIRYPKDVYDESRARKNCIDHKGKFEPAKAEAEMSKIEIIMKSGKFEGVAEEGTKFKKELIRVGNFTHPQFPEERLSITKELIEKWIDNFERYKFNGGKVPVPLRHTEDPDRNAGWLESLSIEGDKLFGVLNITEPEIAKKIENGSITDVSVSIGKNFSDEKGNKYDEFLFHIALTTIPHIRGQETFVKLETGYENVDETVEEHVKQQAEVKKGGGKMDLLKQAQEKVKADKRAELTQEEAMVLLKYEQSEKERLNSELETAKKVSPDTAKLTTLEAESKTNKEKISSLEADLLARQKKEVEVRVTKLCKAGVLPPASKDSMIALAVSKEAIAATIELEVEKEDKTKEMKKFSLVDALFTILEATPAFEGFEDKTNVEQNKPAGKEEVSAEQQDQIAKSVKNTTGSSKSLDAEDKK